MIGRKDRGKSLIWILFHSLFSLFLYRFHILPGYFEFLNESIMIGSIAAISAIYGPSIGFISSLISTLLIVFIPTIYTNNLVNLISTIWCIFMRQIVVAGFTGIIVDTPERIGRTPCWTFISHLLATIFISLPFIANLEYFLGTTIPRHAPIFASSSLLSIIFLTIYSITPKICTKK